MRPIIHELKTILSLHRDWIICANRGKRADLRSADLRFANLRYADLRSANLSYADLSYANLSYADLSYANLRSADLLYADLRSADLRDANLLLSKNSGLAIASTRILPEGTLHVWKKCRNNVLVKLEIPAGSKRSHAFGRKCRAQSAIVLEIVGSTEGVGLYDETFIYRPGETVTAKSWSDDFNDVCAGGVHFFITREEAEAFNL